MVIAVAIPYTVVAAPLDFVPLSLPLVLVLVLITLVYLASNELVKRFFWKPNQRTA